MSETVMLATVLAAAAVGIMRTVSGIIWACRCPKNSARYKHPDTFSLLSLLAGGRADHEGDR